MSKNTSVVRPSVASLMVLALFACEGPESDELADAPRVRSVNQAEVCPAHTQIARVASGGGCPNVPGWSKSALFAGSQGELSKFCRYEWNGAAGEESLDDFPSIIGSTSTSERTSTWGPDCQVVLAQSDALWEVVGLKLEALFHDAIGHASAIDLNLGDTEGSRSPVLVVVVDSVPEGALTPRSEHGELMASLVDDIACPDPDAACKVTVRRSLGLPYWGPDHEIDEINGGDYGSQTSIATAIYDSVESWRTKNWPGETPKLIINLSVGWEAEFGGDDPSSMPPPVESVYEAIAYADCHGAIVIAAAGNQGHLCTDGALVPGRWEEQPAPDADHCIDLSAPPPPTGGAYKPLLYSVGGLDIAAEPMPGTRLNGMPRLAAMATHAVAGGDSTALTGTSVASGVACGAAALLWSYNPQLDAGLVMGSIYGGGKPLVEHANYIMPGPFNPTIHEVDVCGALAHACSRPSSNCPTGFDSLTCLPVSPPPTLDEIFADIAGSNPLYKFTSILGVEQTCDVGCSGGDFVGYLSNTLDSNADPCPAPISPELPYVDPMPTEVACPNCTLDVDVDSHIVYAALDPSYAGIGIDDVTVSVVGPATTKYFRLGPIALSNTEITSILLDSTLITEPVVSANISITFDPNQVPRPVVDDLLLD